MEIKVYIDNKPQKVKLSSLSLKEDSFLSFEESGCNWIENVFFENKKVDIKKDFFISKDKKDKEHIKDLSLKLKTEKIDRYNSFVFTDVLAENWLFFKKGTEVKVVKEYINNVIFKSIKFVHKVFIPLLLLPLFLFILNAFFYSFEMQSFLFDNIHYLKPYYYFVICSYISILLELIYPVSMIIFLCAYMMFST